MVDGTLRIDGEALRPESETCFFAESGATYTFSAGANGKTAALEYTVPGLSLRAVRLD